MSVFKQIIYVISVFICTVWFSVADLIIDPYRFVAAGPPTDYTTNMIIKLTVTTGLKEADTTYPENGDTITAWDDQSGNSNNFTSAAGFTYNSTEVAVDGAGSDGQYFTRTITGGGDDTIFMLVKTTDTSWMAWQGDGAEFVGVAVDASASSPHTSGGTPAYYVDDVVVSGATRNTLHDAVSTGAWVVLTITDVGNSGWTVYRLLGYSGAGFGFADYCKEIRIYSADLTAGERAQVIARMNYDHGT